MACSTALAGGPSPADRTPLELPGCAKPVQVSAALPSGFSRPVGSCCRRAGVSAGGCSAGGASGPPIPALLKIELLAADAGLGALSTGVVFAEADAAFNSGGISILGPEPLPNRSSPVCSVVSKILS